MLYKSRPSVTHDKRDSRVTHVTELSYDAQLSPLWPVISQCLQLLEKRFFKATLRATRAVSALLAAPHNGFHGSWMYDARGDRQQHAGSHTHNYHIISFFFSPGFAENYFVSIANAES